jgi:DNA-binding LytR/AlgR family response regulator
VATKVFCSHCFVYFRPRYNLKKYDHSNSMKCIVVDDDPVQREAIKACIGAVKDLELVGVYPNAIEARLALQKRDVDLIFLDVEMPEMSGIEFLQSFKGIPQVIMVTSKKHYAFQAFEYDVTDYISKPIDLDRFSSAVQRARYYEENLKMQESEDSLFIKSDGVLVNIKIEEILFIEALGDYIKLVTEKERHIVHSTMKAFVAKLPESFLRVHKSHIINLKKVKKLEDNTIELADKKIPVSRNNKKILIERLAQL